MRSTSFGFALVASFFVALPAFAAPPKDVWTWEEKHPAHKPSAGGSHAMVYDEARQRVVLYGWNSSGVWATRTWEWDGDDWQDKTPAPPAKNPGPRTAMSMVYDPVRKKVVLFGGNAPSPSGTGTVDLADTWEWNGTVWVERKPTTSPPGRFNSAMAFDAAHGEVLMHGGENVAGNRLVPRADTWSWNGTNWTKRTPATVPGLRDGYRLGYHPRRKQILLYGGGDDSGGLADTWEWNTSNWFKRSPAHSPGVHYLYALSGAGGRERLVMFGGSQGGYANDVWEWTGTDWERATITGKSPPGRAASGLVYDAARGEYVLFGGHSSTTSRFTDTWVFRPRGGACGDVSDCDSVACVDGVCCDRACDGQCEACNAEGKVGTCSPVTGAPVGGRSCSGSGACGGTCDGTKATCTYPTSTTACGSTTCLEGVRTSFACDGAGVCKSSTSSCPIADAGNEAGSEDAGEPDAGEPDAGEPDAGERDAGEPEIRRPDAGSSTDAGTDGAGASGADVEPDSGCSCNLAGEHTRGAAGSLVLALGVFALRRRPRRRAR